MTNPEFEKLYRDQAVRKRVLFVCNKWWRDKDFIWLQAKHPAFDVEDLESEAWMKILQAPGGKPIAYYVEVAKNHLADQFKIASARFAIMPKIPEDRAWLSVGGEKIPMTEALYGKDDDFPDEKQIKKMLKGRS